MGKRLLYAITFLEIRRHIGSISIFTYVLFSVFQGCMLYIVVNTVVNANIFMLCPQNLNKYQYISLSFQNKKHDKTIT
jgi:hypothetical protein